MKVVATVLTMMIVGFFVLGACLVAFVAGTSSLSAMMMLPFALMKMAGGAIALIIIVWIICASAK